MLVFEEDDLVFVERVDNCLGVGFCWGVRLERFKICESLRTSDVFEISSSNFGTEVER